MGLRLRPTLEPVCEVGGARSAPAQPPSAAGSSFFGALELTLGGQGHVGAMAHGASSTASFSSRGLLSSKNRRGRALVGTIDREIPLVKEPWSGILMGWVSVTGSSLILSLPWLLCGLEHFAETL